MGISIRTDNILIFHYLSNIPLYRVMITLDDRAYCHRYSSGSTHLYRVSKRKKNSYPSIILSQCFKIFYLGIKVYPYFLILLLKIVSSEYSCHISQIFRFFLYHFFSYDTGYSQLYREILELKKNSSLYSMLKSSQEL